MTRFHIIGIGGAGMSAVARVLMGRGHQITGSDTGRWPLSDALARDGTPVHDTFGPAHLGDAEIVIRSSAYKEDNVEVRAALDRGMTVWKRADAWRFLTKDQRVVAVAGTHGKSTTTAMTWLGLRAGGVDASLICGAAIRGLGTNAHAGASDVFVIEADEYDNTFHALDPEVAVVTTLDHDHVDMFPTPESYRDAFRAFVTRIRQGGTLIVDADDPGARDLGAWAAGRGVRALAYGRSESGTHRVWQTDDPGERFALAPVAEQRTRRIGYRLMVRGWHNAMNAAAALLACEAIGVDSAAAVGGIERFAGIERRLESLGSAGDIEVIDDYAHHPAEIRAGLAAFAEHPGHTIVVFQPHTPSRLEAFFDAFVEVLSRADTVVIVETFRSAREKADRHGRARALADAVGGRYAADGEVAARMVADTARPGDAVLVMGAGDVRPVGERVLELLRTPV